MTSVFDKTLEELQPWIRGEPLTARKLNEPLEALNSLRGAIAPLRVETRSTSAEMFGVVVGYADDDPASRVLMVRFVNANPATGTLTALGGVHRVPVWPGLTAGHFAPFVWRGETLTDPRVTVIPIARINGTWWAKQRPRMAISQRTGPVRMLDCQEVG